MSLQRIPGWRSRLELFIDQVKARPFDWAGHDCAVAFAGGAVKAITRTDVAAPFRGQFSTRAEALELMRSAGFADLKEAVSSVLPMHDHPSRMRLGDIVGVAGSPGFEVSLGVCNGAGALLVVQPDGMGVMDQSAAIVAWRVG